MNIWRRREMNESFGIAAGQRFSSADRTRTLWEVVTVARYPGDLGPHVRLQRVGAQHDAKTVSLQVLRDRRFFEPQP